MNISALVFVTLGLVGCHNSATEGQTPASVPDQPLRVYYAVPIEGAAAKNTEGGAKAYSRWPSPIKTDGVSLAAPAGSFMATQAKVMTDRLGYSGVAVQSDPYDLQFRDFLIVNDNSPVAFIVNDKVTGVVHLSNCAPGDEIPIAYGMEPADAKQLLSTIYKGP